MPRVAGRPGVLGRKSGRQLKARVKSLLQARARIRLPTGEESPKASHDGEHRCERDRLPDPPGHATSVRRGAVVGDPGSAMLAREGPLPTVDSTPPCCPDPPATLNHP